MTKIINFFAGPGTGKSTTAAGLFHKMKMDGENVELVTEYAKDMVWEGRYSVLEDQLYIFAKQNRRIARLIGKVDYIITDSPILLGLAYSGGSWGDCILKNLIQHTFEQYDNINFFLKRDTSKYTGVGRMQTLEEAIEKDVMILSLLKEYPHYLVTAKVENTLDDVCEMLKYV